MKLILDYSKWRCGGGEGNPNVLGEGDTQMANKEGFCCCLGLFTPQLTKEEITEDRMINKVFPSDVSNYLNKEIPSLSFLEKDDYDVPYWKNTDLATTAARINDKVNTTPESKIDELQKLFAQGGYKITVINKP